MMLDWLLGYKKLDDRVEKQMAMEEQLAAER